MLTNELENKIKAQGMPLGIVEEQIKNFKDGFPFLDIDYAAKIGDGILELNDGELQKALKDYKEKSKDKIIVKFVPASGAASRMFKNLFSFLEKGDNSFESDDFAKTFISEIKSFAFYEDLDNSLKKAGTSISKAIDEKKYGLIIQHLLDDDHLSYGSLPKGLLKFHQYPEESRTPVEEHFVEGAQYGIGKDNTVRLHFTVSPEHQKKFEEKVAEVQPKMEKEFGVKFEISFSQQKKSTDTIAVSLDNKPFVEDNGELLFRPAGHGALLENLNEIEADLVFIKNIDNVVPDRLKDTTTTYKQAIGGLLIEAQDKTFAALKQLDNKVTDKSVSQAEEVFTKVIGGKLAPSYGSKSLDEKASWLSEKLNRPMRVCGMVENTGEPGGGPFWVKDSDGSLSLQIGETAQLNLEDKTQEAHFKSSTHFNPTDLVCGIRDYKGKAFNLMEYRDPKTGFITQKSKSGRDLKAQELPGLWNGSMANWNSIFVVVPLITFNPVKTINDLLRDVHQ
ncbi:DUF4301 family protein [Cyclobacterium qasimii]|uniref:Ribosylnicotinamide kinase-like protein n=2 Tax=Cyclobacterium qasimii TaxID=1350429 RepID=S7VN92_9BACT|nr:DUF4301 family protein [Cyclobacterium qasimii]EPR71456.1 Ribosylnicotinamide kinase-like protein [Cyclobacterium qasimii M12-11B]GEO23642.1 hypothetical protein CQA01_41760 [Cyclobacterium qasimii]